MLTLVACLGMVLLQERPDNPGPWELKSNGNAGLVAGHVSAAAHPVLNAWGRWDAGWYMQIAQSGYQFTAGQQSSAAFFPLFPLLIRSVHTVVPSSTDASWIFCGVLVANAALLAALYYLVLLVRLDFDEATASRSVLFLLVFPTTLFFSAMYTESLFLAVTVASFYYARKNRWLLAGALAGAAALTRSPGVLIGPPLLIEYLSQRNYRFRAIRADVLGLAFIPLALASHVLYLYWRFGNLFAIRDAQSAWGRPAGLTWPWVPFVQFFSQPFAVYDAGNSLVNMLFATLFLVLSIIALVKLRLSYGLYAISCYLFVTGWGSFGSVPRYILAAFPVFMVLGMAGRSPIFTKFYTPMATGLAALLMVLFACWRWVA
jgi:Gpi18-like mannosyltransferase